jgi:CheY-like chemotaxis protein
MRFLWRLLLFKHQKGHINKFFMEKKMTQVLLVEDNTIIVMVITHIVTKQGYQIQVAQDATTGLAMSKEQRFDLILMDIGLPDGSGDQVALQIRQDATNPNQATPLSQ